MKTLIVEDDFSSRLLLQEILQAYGPVKTAGNGRAGVELARLALAANEPYDLICLDIMMPVLDGQNALREIRRFEGEAGIAVGQGSKILMTTALSDPANILGAFREACDGYLLKPIDKGKLLAHLRQFGLIA